MYCPKCGQQLPEGLRFCSRCGFPLDAVALLLARDGILPTDVPEESGKRSLSPRRKGLRQGVALMFIGLVLTPILAVLVGPPHGDPFGLPFALIPLSAIIGFWGGLLRILYALIFQEGAPRAPGVSALPYAAPGASAQLGHGPRASALPPPQSVPATGWRSSTNTAELAHPPSVTEGTTKLLHHEDDANRS